MEAILFGRLTFGRCSIRRDFVGVSDKDNLQRRIVSKVDVARRDRLIEPADGDSRVEYEVCVGRNGEGLILVRLIAQNIIDSVCVESTGKGSDS